MANHTHRFSYFAVLLLALPSVVLAQPVDEALILQRITKATPHPRLYWPAKDDADVLAKINSDSRLKSAWDAVRITADHMLGEPPVVYRKDGRRLLGRSREALSRVLHLGFAFRVTRENRYAERVAVEMEAMAGMPDWNPSHFLDTAEMTMAMAVGYDWLYAELTPNPASHSSRGDRAKGTRSVSQARLEKRLGAWRQ